MTTSSITLLHDVDDNYHTTQKFAHNYVSYSEKEGNENNKPEAEGKIFLKCTEGMRKKGAQQRCKLKQKSRDI